MKEKIESALNESLASDTSAHDWYEELTTINEVLSEAGADITMDGIDGGGVMCCYYSSKIHQSIILEWDAYHRCENNSELAQLLADHQEDAERIEKQLPPFEQCAHCGENMYTFVRAHHHTEDGKDVSK